MLRELKIRNIAVIEEATIAFDTGLTILTGETGAGKSIVVDSLELVMGGRGSAEIVRTGCDEASVEALFTTTPGAGVLEKLRDMDMDSDGEIIVRRIISTSGRSKAYVNGTMVNLATLSAIVGDLVDIHGQHEHQSLLSPQVQLSLLDSYARLTADAAVFRAGYQSYMEGCGNLDKMKHGEQERGRRRDLLMFQAEEIAAARLQAGEDEHLAQEHGRLANAERLRLVAEEAYVLLHGGDCAPGESILRGLRKVASNMAVLCEYDASLFEQAKTAEGCLAMASDMADFMRDYASKLEADPEALVRAEDRLDLLGRLKRKYGNTSEDILSYHKQIEEELQLLESTDTRIAGLEKEMSEAKERLLDRAHEISEKRKDAACALEAVVQHELASLGMTHARFVVNFEGDRQQFSSAGIDKVTFLIAPNPGEEPKPLAQIASGGELSRTMLAVKAILAGEDSVPTLVFDEVDSGIGGRIADAVGNRLKGIAKRHQVLVVTHLPQVAGHADHHFHIAKKIADGRTFTCVKMLDRQGRIAEIARMLGGKEDTALKHAEEMLAAG